MRQRDLTHRAAGGGLSIFGSSIAPASTLVIGAKLEG
jgi:hypothetical protein